MLIIKFSVSSKIKAIGRKEKGHKPKRLKEDDEFEAKLGYTVKH